MPKIARVTDTIEDTEIVETEDEDGNIIEEIVEVTTIISKGSPNVFANSLSAARIGDPCALDHHISVGSKNVFINNKGAVRLNDLDDNDGIISSGSNNVFVNG